VRRLLTALILAAAAGALSMVAAGGDAGDEARRYTVELDNAFGLVEGGDVRVAGVNAGRVVGLDLDRRTRKALVAVEITEQGFGSLRSDAFCESRPQSPIGEYFLDCLPGTSRRELKAGARVPVRQTASTIPPDLVQNIMRLPYRERFRLIVNEFGAGLAGRPEDLNEAIRRGVPALRQSARLLGVLADHNRVIRDLVANADRVVGRLAANRRDVGRFVVEARDTASASAERREDIATNFRKLPLFLEQLTPTMAALGEAAEEQRPVLVDLNASAGELRRFFDDSADFYDASRPALRALAEAAVPGRQAMRAGRPRVRELRDYAARTPDLGRNLRITLEDFDDQDRAVERDPRSPGGRGYSGTQALLSYPFNQSLVNNAFDELGYMVRAAAHTDHCSPYAAAETAQRPDKADCRSWLGPNQPGVTTPDVSDALASPAGAGERSGGERGGGGRAGGRSGGGGRNGHGGLGDDGSGGDRGGGLQRLLDGLLGGAPRPELPAPPAPAPDPRGLDDASSLLDFLLGP
jgi:ABC-type transporter Mla subunit MlaD